PVTACHGPSPSWNATSAALPVWPLTRWLVSVIVTGRLASTAPSLPPLAPPSGARSAGGTFPHAASTDPQAAISNSAGSTHRMARLSPITPTLSHRAFAMRPRVRARSHRQEHAKHGAAGLGVLDVDPPVVLLDDARYDREPQARPALA